MTSASHQPRRGSWERRGVLVCCASPLLLIVADALLGRLSADPIASVMNRLGYWALFLLLVSLTPTPLARWTRFKRPLMYRRMFGLWAFAYAALHVATYVGLDHFFDFREMWADIVERPFMTAGFAAFLVLCILAGTSNRRAMKRLGRFWKRVHRLSYAAAALGVLHFVWRVKADELLPFAFATVLAVLLAARVVDRRSKTTPHRAAAAM